MRLLLFILLLPMAMHGQEYPFEHNDTLYLQPGVTYYEGQEISLAQGSLQDGSFESIYIKSLTDGNDVNLNAKNSGKKPSIKKIEKKGGVYLLSLKGEGLLGYYCNIEQALELGEISNPSFKQPIINTDDGVTTNNNSDYPYLQNDVLYISKDCKLPTGENITIGTGTMPDGDFKFIRININSMFGYTGTDKEKVANANALHSRASGLKYKVIRIEKRGNKKRGYVFYPVITYGIVRYDIDIMNALRTGEVVLPGYQPPTQKPVIIQQVSKADELKKLKELKDQGVLTEDEFQAEKQKILAQ